MELVPTKQLPQLVDCPDMGDLLNLCANHIKDIVDGNEDDDDEHYIYEEVMKTLYGEDVFVKLREYVK